ncbi:unnamed protein product [Cercospora beticola]|nr:unnamed protein product [Cercospora beticola]
MALLLNPTTTDPDPTACGLPQSYDASSNFAGKKVVLVSVPGAFTPGCQAFHLPPFLQKIDQLQARGIDLVVVIASNDAFVMSAWGKVRQAKSQPFVRLYLLMFVKRSMERRRIVKFYS